MAGGGRERRGSRGRRDLAQILQGLGDGGADMEEVSESTKLEPSGTASNFDTFTDYDDGSYATESARA